jgi:hypothetical protein
LGDLDPATVRVLDRAAGAFGPAAALGPRLSPGTLLVREWAGQEHRVTVLDDGFCWRDQIFRSLSEVARAITGTRWNGPRFFGRRGGAPVTRKASRRLRCAIYTRVSTDHGLEQDFNSLDAQREAAEAYIKSQAHEGWVLIRTAYDDGGFPKAPHGVRLHAALLL